MDRAFLEYYEDELTHIRHMGQEFATQHPAVAGRLSLDTVPCPDPYVERLLEGVAFLTARARMKVDVESARFARNVLEALYPDLVGPSPAVSTVVLTPGPQVQTMENGHLVKRGTRLIAGLREGLSTRAVYTTAQDVHLWPIRIAGAEYVQDRAGLLAAGLPEDSLTGAEAALRITLEANGNATLAALSLDQLDLHFSNPGTAGGLFDAIIGTTTGVLARSSDDAAPVRADQPVMLGLGDDEALLSRSRPTFEGHRLLREYFLMPERFHYARITGLRCAVAAAGNGPLDVFLLFDRPARAIADVSAEDFRLNATPIVNLFEKECSVVELNARNSQQILHADRARTRDFEIYQILSVEDAERDGPAAEIPPLFSLAQNRGSGLVFSAERKPRRMDEDERRNGQYRTSYPGNEMFISVSKPAGEAKAAPVRRLDIRALCTNRDLPLLDDTPTLGLESGDPVGGIELLGALRRPRSALDAALPSSTVRETRRDEMSWRLISQLSLNYLSLAEATTTGEPLRAVLDLYADRGDPGLARHVRSISRVTSRQVVERLPIKGPICFGQGVEVTLDIDETALTGGARLMLSALLATLFANAAGINSFVRTQTRLNGAQDVVTWPHQAGRRPVI